MKTTGHKTTYQLTYAVNAYYQGIEKHQSQITKMVYTQNYAYKLETQLVIRHSPNNFARENLEIPGLPTLHSGWPIES